MPSLYKHSLRRHVPSRPIQPSPSPPDSPKSDAASISSRRPKRERAKEAIEHFFDKFHIHHHHHHLHGHDHSLDDSLTSSPTVATDSSSAYGLKTPSLTDKENLIAFEVPPLQYDSVSIASSSENVDVVKVAQDVQPTPQPIEPAASDLPMSSSHDAFSVDSPDDVQSTHSAQEILTSESTPLETTMMTSVPPFAEEISQKDVAPALDTDDSAEPPAEVSELPASSVSQADARPLSVDFDTPSLPVIIVTEVVSESNNDINDSVDAEPVTGVVTSTELASTQSREDVSDIEAPIDEDIVAITVADIQLTAAPYSPSDINNIGSARVMVDTPCQTDEMDMISLHEVEQFSSLVTQQQVATAGHYPLKPSPITTSPALIKPSSSAYSQSSLSPRPSYAKIPYTRTEPIVPLYPELRKLANTRPTKKPSWIRYIYRSFVKPAVSVARECTVAAMNYGYTRILEARPPALREATSWLV